MIISVTDIGYNVMFEDGQTVFLTFEEYLKFTK